MFLQLKLLVETVQQRAQIAPMPVSQQISCGIKQRIRHCTGWYLGVRHQKISVRYHLVGS